MEEILASIRRIISEDEPAAEAPAEATPVVHVEPEAEPEPAEPEPVSAAEPEDVLELTQLAPEPEPYDAPSALETHGDIEVHAPAPIPPEPVKAPPLSPAPVSFVEEDALMSPSPSASAASAFGHLAHTVTMPSEGRVLEDVVRELLRPLLKTWLDENLPLIVQAKVDEEVERIARRRVG